MSHRTHLILASRGLIQRGAYAFLVCDTHFEGGRWDEQVGLAAGNLAGPITATSLPHYDAVHRRFRQAKLGCNDAHAVYLADAAWKDVKNFLSARRSTSTVWRLYVHNDLCCSII